MSSPEIYRKIIDRFHHIQGVRQLYHPMWDNITEFVLPNRQDFNYTRAIGATKDRRLFDTTAIRANEFLASTLKDGIMPLYEMWGKVGPRDDKLRDNETIALYFDKINEIMYDAFNNPNSNFHSQNHELLLDLCAYGTGIMYIDEDSDTGLRFKTIALSEIYVSEDKNGMIDTVFRKFKLTPRQACQQWGDENLSLSLQKMVSERPDDFVEFLHCVKPNDEYDGTYIPIKGNLPISSFYFELETAHCLEEGGYHEMPYKVPRWFKFVGEIYGRSPAWNAMPDIMMVNKLRNLMIRAEEKKVDPIYLLADDGVVLPLDTRPGGVNFGGVDPVTGRLRVQTLPNTADLSFGLKYLEMVQTDIRHAFYVDPLELQHIDRATTTEINQRKDEQLRAIGPQVGRIQTEYVGPLIQRVYGILERAGVFPKLDPQTQKLLDRKGLGIEYDAPLFNTQRRQEPLALTRALQTLVPFAQVDPTFWDNFDLDVVTREVSAVEGVPLTYMSKREEMDKKRAQRAQNQAQQQQQEQQMMQAESQSRVQANLNRGNPQGA